MKISSSRAAVLALLVAAAIGCGDKSSSSSKSAEAKAEPPSTGKSSKAGSTDAANEATITKRYAVVGDVEKSTKVKTFAMKAKIKGPDGMVDVESTENETIEKTEECLAIADKQCSKAKVSFVKYEGKKVTNGKSKDEAHPTVGKTYIIERKGKDLAVTLADGSAASEAEQKDIKDTYKRFGRRKDKLAAMPDKVKVGDSLDELAKVLGEEAAQDDDDDGDAPPKVTSKIVVKAIREEGGKKIVTLDVAMSMEGDSKKVGHMKIEMKGTVDLRADIAQDVTSELAGPLEIDFANDGGKATGDMKEKTTSSYSF